MDITLSEAQSSVFLSPARFRVFVAGRRSGKTFLAIMELLRECKTSGVTVWYVAPTYRQAESVLWAELKNIAGSLKIIKKINEVKLRLTLINDSVIELKGADNYESLRGVGNLSLLVLDEFATMKENAYLSVLLPMLADKQGRCLFIGTPRGYNHLYDYYIRGQKGSDDQWRSWQYTTEQCGQIPKSELAAMKKSMPATMYKQEFLATFETIGGRVYYAFSIDNIIKPPVISNTEKIYIGMDFNVDPMTAVLGVKRDDNLLIFKEIELHDSNTYEMSAELRRLAPQGTTVFPDPTGRARKTSAQVGDTDFSILRRAGFKVQSPSGTYPIIDRYNTTNGKFLDASGFRSLFISNKCKTLVKACFGLSYKEGTHIADKSGGLDHITDALGYLVMGLFYRPNAMGIGKARGF